MFCIYVFILTEKYHGTECFGADKAGSKRTQPPWQPPSGSVNVGLQIFNSLTRKKVSK